MIATIISINNKIKMKKLIIKMKNNNKNNKFKIN